MRSDIFVGCIKPLESNVEDTISSVVSVTCVSLQVSVQQLSASATSSVISSGLWGLDRIDQKSNRRDYQYHYSSVGTGVHVYTVDTVQTFIPALSDHEHRLEDVTQD